MFILILVFFIIFIIAFVYLFYCLKVIEDDIEALYDTYFTYLDNSFRKVKEDNA